MGGGEEKKKPRILYRRSDERSAKKTEIKAFPNRKLYKTHFIKNAVCPKLSLVFRFSGY
jgi:hypothetical protein